MVGASRRCSSRMLLLVMLLPPPLLLPLLLLSPLLMPMLLRQQIHGSPPRSARAVNKNSNSGDVVGSSSARGVRGLPPIGHRRIFVPLFRSSRAQPHPLLSRPPLPPSLLPMHRSLYSSPSSTCYHSRNGPMVVSRTREGGRRQEGGRRVTQRRKEGCRAMDGGDARGRGNRTGGTQEFSPSPTFHPGLQRIVSDTRAHTHTNTRIHTRVRARALELVAHEWYTFIYASRSRSAARTRIPSRTRTTPHEYPRGPRSMPMHTHTDQKQIHVARRVGYAHISVLAYVCTYTYDTIRMIPTYTYTHACARVHTHSQTERERERERLVPSVPSRLSSFAPASPLSSKPSDQRRLSASLSSFSLFHPPSPPPASSRWRALPR